MDNFAILAIVALIAVALLLLGAGLVVYFLKRGKGSAAAGQASAPGPNQMGAPPMVPGPQGVGGPEPQGAPGWPPPAPPQQQQQQWGTLESTPSPAHDWPADAEAPHHEPDPASAYQTQDGGFPEEQESYVTTPGTSTTPPVPNPELFLTTPSGPRQTSLMDMQAQLQADDGTIIPLDRLMMRVGRHPECDIVVPTPGTSRQHAEFEFRDGAWNVTDLNSGNGTWVNGVRVKAHQLSPGDEVRIDQTRFRFTSGS